MKDEKSFLSIQSGLTRQRRDPLVISIPLSSPENSERACSTENGLWTSLLRRAGKRDFSRDRKQFPILHLKETPTSQSNMEQVPAYEHSTHPANPEASGRARRMKYNKLRLELLRSQKRRRMLMACLLVAVVMVVLFGRTWFLKSKRGENCGRQQVWQFVTTATFSTTGNVSLVGISVAIVVDIVTVTPSLILLTQCTQAVGEG